MMRPITSPPAPAADDVALLRAARVDGDFPSEILCPPAVDAGTAGCRGEAAPGATAGDRRYALLSRVEERPRLTPELLRAAIAGRPSEEILFPDAAPRYRLNVGRVLELADRAPEDFWRGMDLLLSVQGGTVSAGDQDGLERVPPRGVRRFITCVDDDGLRCRPTTNGESLPVGAPMYALQPDATWRSVPQRTTGDTEFVELQRQAFGRDLTDDEQVLVIAMLLPARDGSGDGSGGATAAQPPPTPEPVTEVTPAP